KAEKLDARTDIFSLGVVMYEMLTGQQAFAAASRAEAVSAILTRDPPPLRTYVTEAPESLEVIVRKAIHKDKQSRYQSAADLVRDLNNVGRKPAGHGIGTRARNKRHFSTIAVLAVITVLIVAAALAYRALVNRTRVITSIAILPFVNATGE